MIPNVGFVVAAFARGTVPWTLERSGAVTFTDGTAIPAAVSTMPVSVLAMPEGRRLERLAEGDQTPDRKVVFLADEGVVIEGSRASGTGASRQPDVLIDESGIRWVVDEVGDWSAAGYRRVVCKREGA